MISTSVTMLLTMDYLVNNLDQEMAFIGGQFFESELPKERRYLLKYFKSDIQQQFLRYMLMFGSCVRFTEHTGYHCSKRWLKVLKSRLRQLEAAKKTARESMDLETLTLIETGKYHVGS